MAIWKMCKRKKQIVKGNVIAINCKTVK